MHYPRVDTTISPTKQPIRLEDDQREGKRDAKIDWSRRTPVHGQSATNMVNMFKAKWGKILREPRDFQTNHNLHHVQVHILMQQIVPKHETKI